MECGVFGWEGVIRNGSEALPFAKGLAASWALGGHLLELRCSGPPESSRGPSEAALTSLVCSLLLAVPGEVPRDPALQVREPAAHPSGHVVLVPALPHPGCGPLPTPSLCSFCLMRGCLLGWVVSVGLREVQGIRLNNPRWEK